MPNHCSNALVVIGPDAPAFMAAVADGATENFIDTLIPMPEELQSISSGSCIIDGERVTEWRTDADGKNTKIPDLDRQHLVDLHGTCDLLNWTRDKWGTKWGAYSVAIDWDAKSILFDSAWAPPQTAIDTISTMFPYATFTLAYAEGGSCYYGRMIFEDGTLMESEEFTDFWDESTDEDMDDPMDRITANCREHLDTYGLHVGG